MAEQAVRILGCRTHYQVLQLDDPVFTDAQQVRRRFKHLAIRVHPDKNRAADAEAAFRRLSEAYECLVDPGLQREYLRQLQVLHKSKTTKRKHSKRQRDKTKTATTEAAAAAGEDDDATKTFHSKRRRTAQEIWELFQQEEEELARKQFLFKGFDRNYVARGTEDSAAESSLRTAEQTQRGVLDSNLDRKARNWTRWSKSGSTRTKCEPTALTSPRSTEEKAVCCMLCRRKFLTSDALDRHKTLSKLHLANVQAQKNTEVAEG